MTTRKFSMPASPEIGAVSRDGKVQLNERFQKYLGGLEDVSGRVADFVSDTPTATQLRDALIAAGLMKAE
jgi:hypothetical protein